jgi:hypothetical protein
MTVAAPITASRKVAPAAPLPSTPPSPAIAQKPLAVSREPEALFIKPLAVFPKAKPGQVQQIDKFTLSTLPTTPATANH